MKLSLSQSEIEYAVRAYMHTLLNVAPGVTFNIDFAATRGPEGFTANIEMVPPKEAEEKAEMVDEPVPAQATQTRKPRATPTLTKAPEKAAAEPEAEVATTAQAAAVEEKADTSALASAEAEVQTQAAAEPETKAADTQKPGTGFPGFAGESDGAVADHKDDDQSGADAAASAVNDAAATTAEPVKTEAEPVKKPSLFANLRQG